jgi:hypothetical protein
LLSSKYQLYEVDVFYEPPPQSPEPSWLRTLRPYSYPQETYAGLRPRAPFGTTYGDGSTGDFDWDRNGTFSVPVRLSRSTPGIYTALFFIKRYSEDKPFPAAQVCIRVE